MEVVILLIVGACLLWIISGYNKKESELKEVKDGQDTIVRSYTGTEQSTNNLFKKESITLANKGYQIVSQNYTPGNWSGIQFLIALLLCFILVGIIIFIYMIIVKPQGTLTVTYKLTDSGRVATKNDTSKADELMKLVKLRDDNILTEREFQDQKEKLLNSL